MMSFKSIPIILSRNSGVWVWAWGGFFSQANFLAGGKNFLGLFLVYEITI
jgi:hypothetical protein